MKISKYKKQTTIVLVVLALLAYVNIAFAMYNPNTGRFNRLDPFTGKKEEPQSMHKYAYCWNNPVNRVDPTGRASTFTYNELNVTNAVQAQMQAAINVIVSYHVYQAAQSLDRALIERDIKLFVLSHQTPGTLTQQEFQNLENMLRIRTRGKVINLYLRYGFMEDKKYYITGGLRSPSWCTRTVYPTGWYAKWYLALYKKGPRNAVYIVLPHSNTLMYGPNAVRGRTDEDSGVYLPGRGIMGQGEEWYFPNGTGPGTVFGPIPLPEGSLESVK